MMKIPEDQAKFDAAELYEIGDGEELSWTTPEEAIEQWLDGWLSPGCDAEKIITEHTPLTVTAYVRMKVDERFVQRRAEFMMEDFAEAFCEDYMNPNEHTELVGEKEATVQLIALLRDLIAKQNIWACDPVAKKEYSTDEILKMMREENPDWFEKKETTP